MTISNAQQTAYGLQPDNRSLLGMAAFPDNEYDTAQAGEELHYGEAVVVGTAGEPIVVIKPTNATGNFFGVVYKGDKTANSDGLSFYKADDGMAVVTEGPVWSKCNSSVLKGEAAYVDALVTLGAFTNISTGNQDVKARFLTNASNGKALVRLSGIPS